MIIGQKLGELLRLPGIFPGSKTGNCISCGRCSSACPMSLDIGSMAWGNRNGVKKRGVVRISRHDCIYCTRCAVVCAHSVISAGFGSKK